MGCCFSKTDYYYTPLIYPNNHKQLEISLEMMSTYYR